MLRKIRLSTAVVFFTVITLLFLDFTGTLHYWFGWMTKIQFMPAILALNVGVVAVLILLSLLFGRIYCSIICPLGVFQDIIARIGIQGKKLPYSYSPGRSWLRYGILLIFIVCLIAGIGSLVALLEPYSSFGRIANNLFAPIWLWGNNLLAYLSERIESYAFYEVEVWLKSLPTFLIAITTFIILFILAWRNGRTYCNTICPIGTVLGFLSRYSLFRVTIDTNKCNGCGLCSRNCKAACINSKKHHIDYSRCVVCGNCIDKCKNGAIKYKLNTPAINLRSQNIDKQQKPTESNNETRRSFLTVAALMTGTYLLQAQKKGDGGLAFIENKKIPKRNTPIVPAGSSGLRHMFQHCTACQLCVSVCPNQVLRPSSDLKTLMQPEMSYERGYCRPECIKCSEVCPSKAIKPISIADKSSIQIGHAVWIKENCIASTEKVRCDNCARHCPTGAIQMVASDSENPKSHKIPIVNIERCIGCGACEYLCPARPFSAFYIEGHERHRMI